MQANSQIYDWVGGCIMIMAANYWILFYQINLWQPSKVIHYEEITMQ